MKLKGLIVPTVLVGLLAACGSEETAEPVETEETPAEQAAVETEEKPAEEAAVETEEEKSAEEAAKETEETETDAVSTASITADPEEFKQALSKEGTWIVAATDDITLDEELVVEGEFHDKGDEANPIYRKLGLYTQDDQRNVTDTFTLTVPSMLVQSENFKIQNGTVKGDVIVAAKGFTLAEDTTIDGNLLFASEEVKESAQIDGEVTGKQELQ
ncbi:hypothetical protein R4Z10_07300 [Niallia sp. XMNu-256]|uniref:hypothetical protein n=1 Tax=Niallia sp. XMNu-256 TaxID=3082444 RepID=UPI0030CF17D7